METRGVAGVVAHRAADAAAGVVLAEFDRVASADHPLWVQYSSSRAGLVGDPVLVGMPERSGFEDDDLPALPGEPLGQDAPAGPGADDRPGRPRPDRVARTSRSCGHGAWWTSSRNAGVVLGGAERARSRVRNSWRRLTSALALLSVLDRVGYSNASRALVGARAAGLRQGARSRAAGPGHRSRSRSTTRDGSRRRGGRPARQPPRSRATAARPRPRRGAHRRRRRRRARAARPPAAANDGAAAVASRLVEPGGDARHVRGRRACRRAEAVEAPSSSLASTKLSTGIAARRPGRARRRRKRAGTRPRPR